MNYDHVRELVLPLVQQMEGYDKLSHRQRMRKVSLFCTKAAWESEGLDLRGKLPYSFMVWLWEKRYIAGAGEDYWMEDGYRMAMEIQAKNITAKEAQALMLLEWQPKEDAEVIREEMQKVQALLTEAYQIASTRGNAMQTRTVLNQMLRKVFKDHRDNEK